MRKAIPFLILGLAVGAVVSCNNDVTGLEPPSDPATETFDASLGVNIATMTKTQYGVWVQDVTVGTGAQDSSITDSMTITYVGHLKTGAQFDAGTGVTFNVSLLVAGMHYGLLGMKEGGKRKIVIPSALGYGAQAVRDTSGAVKIPRQATLVFDVDLTKVFQHVDSTTTTSLRRP